MVEETFVIFVFVVELLVVRSSDTSEINASVKFACWASVKILIWDLGSCSMGSHNSIQYDLYVPFVLLQIQYIACLTY
jgi:hypothetical protein